MDIKHEYIAVGPELYKRVYWPEQPIDSYVATYVSDEAAKDAAIVWNERMNNYKNELTNPH